MRTKVVATKSAAMKATKAPAMKAVVKAKNTGRPMSKGGLAEAIAGACELKRKVATQALDSLARIAAAEVKKQGVFTLPGLTRIKTRKKPATKAGKRMMFGKEVLVAAKPAKTVVKAFAVAALKKNF